MSLPLLVIRALTKVFPGTIALDGIDLTLVSGQISAIVGHNGSGKSTLVKTLAGIYRPDEGTIEMPHHDRRAEGLHFIHQDLGLIDDLSVVENLNLGQFQGIAALRAPRRRREVAEVQNLIEGFGVQIDPLARVRDLAPAERTMVAIARAMSRWSDPRQVLILDEPTATLQDREAEAVLSVTRRIADRGAAVLFISHRLREVERIADEVTVFRDGRTVATMSRGEFTSSTLVDLIAGGTAESRPAGPKAESGRDERVALKIAGFEAPRINDVNIEVRRGEIVGISGVTGSGVDEILGMVFGGRTREHGTVEVDGVAVPAGSPRASIAAGMGYVPADRHRHGAILRLSARENLTLPRLAPLRRPWGAIDRRAENTEVGSQFTRASIVPNAPERPLSTFSGGNQQKVILARWMRTPLKVLLLEEPTQGVDVGAQDGLYELIRKTAAEGAGVLIASSDTKELVELCDRVIVLVDGRELAQLAGQRLDEATLIRWTLSSPDRSEAPTGAPPKPEEK